MLGTINLAVPGNGRPLRYASPNSSAAERSSGAAQEKKNTALDALSSIPSDNMTLRFETSGGKKGTLHWSKDMLASVGGNGGTVNARYHESSTKDDPIAVIWGTDSGGRSYETIIHLNDVNPHDATPGEMIALNAHLSKINGKNDASPVALWSSIGVFGTDSQTDYESYYSDYIAMQKQSGNQAGAQLYQIQLERFLFSFQQAAENTQW